MSGDDLDAPEPHIESLNGFIYDNDVDGYTCACQLVGNDFFTRNPDMGSGCRSRDDHLVRCCDLFQWCCSGIVLFDTVKQFAGGGN